MNRKHSFSFGEYYHLYNRGVDKRTIFQDDSDSERFILLLYLCNTKQSVDLQKLFREGLTFTKIFELDRGEPLIAIGTWCLMGNHFHLFVKELSSGGIAKVLQKVTTGYSMYFNKKYSRSGNLFEGTFKSEHATNDEYLRYLFSYIHLNPVKLINEEPRWKEIGVQNIETVKDFLSNYPYSSLRDYPMIDILYGKIISKKEFPNYFSTIENIWDELFRWLTYKNNIELVKVKPSQV